MVLAVAGVIAAGSSAVAGDWLGGWLGRGEATPTRRIHQRPSHPNGYQDGMVIHAGGAYAGQVRSLDKHGLHDSRAAGGHHCRDGACGDHCVARPDVFGFYGTRWRSWPGTSVVQASAADAATPVSPPRSEPPSERAESLDPEAPIEFGVEEPLDDESQLDSITLPGLGPARPAPPKPPRSTVREPREAEPAEREPAPRPRPSDRPRSDRPPNGEKPSAPSEPERTPEPKPKPKSPDDNLFDESSNRRRLQERLAVIRAEARETSGTPTRFPGGSEAKPLAREKSQPPAERPVQPASAGLRYPQTVSPLGILPQAPTTPKVPMPSNPLR